MIGEIIGLLGDVVNLVGGLDSGKDYQKSLQEQADKQRVSASAKRGANILSELANQGLPGYESQKSELDSNAATTIGQARDYMTSTEMMSLLPKLYSKVNEGKRELGYANDAALIKNKQNLASYLGGTLAPMENQVLENQTALGIAGAQNKYGTEANVTKSIGNMFTRTGNIFDNPDFLALLGGNKGGNLFDKKGTMSVGDAGFAGLSKMGNNNTESGTIDKLIGNTGGLSIGDNENSDTNILNEILKILYKQ